MFSLLVLYGKRRKLLLFIQPPPPPLRLMPGMETTKKRVLDIISTFLRQILECGRKGNKNSRNFSWLIRGGFGLIRSEGKEKESKKWEFACFKVNAERSERNKNTLCLI